MSTCMQAQRFAAQQQNLWHVFVCSNYMLISVSDIEKQCSSVQNHTPQKKKKSNPQMEMEVELEIEGKQRSAADHNNLVLLCLLPPQLII